MAISVELGLLPPDTIIPTGNKKKKRVPGMVHGNTDSATSSTKKASVVREEMRPEYDFSNGVRGKYAERYAEGTNLVLLAPDVAAEFPTAEAVNKALRTVINARSKRRTA